jgi:serine phosphatase RsbU (regulator of sigma subunit)
MLRYNLRFPLWLGLLLVAFWCGAEAQAQAGVPVLKIESLGKGTAAIDGPWQFHIGDNMTWAQTDAPDTTGVNGWEQLTACAPWGAQGHPSYAGFGWYRKHLHLIAASNADGNFAILIPQIDDVYEIYWNGQLVGKRGEFPPHARYPYLGPQHTFGIGAARDGVLAVRVWKAPLQSFDAAEIGGFEGVPQVGGVEAIGAAKTVDDYQWLRGLQFRFGLNLFYGIITVLGVWMWLRNRKQWVLLAVAAYCGAHVAVLVVELQRLEIPETIEMGFIQLILGIQDVGLWYLLLLLFQLDRAPKLARFTRILAIVDLAAFMLDGSLSFLDWSHPLIAPWVQGADGLLTAVVTTTEIYPLVLIFFALRRRLDPARWFLAIAATIDALLSELRITFEQGSRFTNWRFAEKLNDPVFTLNGNQFTPTVLAGTLLLAAIVYAVYQVVRETAQKQSDLEREFQSARELQQVLIPETLPRLPGYAVTSAYRPAQEVGGDFFQMIPLEGHFAGSTLVMIGDVSGKGLKAAMTVSLIVGAARALAKVTYKPSEILAALNAQLYGRMSGGFATCMVMRLSPAGRCTLSSAGHPAPILNDGEIETNGSLPLGILPDTEYQEVAMDLREGDHLALYTDGLLEARTRNGELFSFGRLKEMFSVKTDAAQATEMAVEFGQEDDITVLTVRRLASSEESSTKLHTHVMPAVAR